MLLLCVGGAALLFCIILAAVSSHNRNNLSLTLNGSEEMQVEYGQEFQDPGVTALKLSSGATVDTKSSGKVNTSRLGSYTITYKAGGVLGSVSIQRTVDVVDTTAPTIELITVDGSYTEVGDRYFEEGYTATDAVDGDLTDKVTSYEEDGKVYYSVTDSSGNEATAVRKIRYHDSVNPNITLEGDEDMTLDPGALYTEPGYTAADDGDGNLTSEVTVDGAVNAFAEGTYTLTYSVTDSQGNTSIAQRNVTVTQAAVPTEKVVYLTFDDGPGPYTQELLDILAKYNVKATFFVTNGYPDYVDMISAEAAAGHSIAVHSATHDYSKIYTSEEAYFNDLNTMNDIIEAQTGERTTMIRFPGGSSNTVSRKYCSGIMSTLAADLAQQGYSYYDWNITSGDAGDTTDTQEIISNVISGMQKRNASIVLQHDVKDFSVAAVESIVVWGLNNGYCFLPLSPQSPTAHQTIAN
jgi:peptidoglycan/xylan/chitin deacetylase (PgdA/CDA1 family)